MSKGARKHEGRAKAERYGRLIVPPGYNAKKAKAKKVEEADWAARSGPVEVKKPSQSVEEQ